MLSETSHEAIHHFLAHLQDERNMSEHTIRNYGVDLAQFYEFLATGGDGDAGRYPRDGGGA